MPHHLIIAGSRTITDEDWVHAHIDRITAGLGDNIMVISGMAKGPDMMGARWAVENGHRLVEMPADWDKHGRSAGYKRNDRMARHGTHLIAFWDGESRGTQHMITLAREHNLKVRIVRSS